MGIISRLERHESAEGPASIAIIGAGYVAKGVLQTLSTTPAVAPNIVVNRSVDRAIDAALESGVTRENLLVSDNPSELGQAVEAGKFVVTADYSSLKEVAIDIVVEATGALDYGTRVILDSLRAGRHVISYNAEVDSLLAWRFHSVADEHGVIYTIADGDQPGALFRLTEQVEAMGFQVKAMLNCKRHMNVHQNPGSGAEYSARDTTSALMTTAFGDGTKMQVEQAVVANATGMAPSCRGMNGVETSVDSIIDDTDGLWPEKMPQQSHIPSDEVVHGVVDYTLGGDFGAGVGVVATHPEGQHHKKAMSLYKMGDGPNYFFFRPYHLVHLELPLTVKDILLNGHGLATVQSPHVASVVAIAKKDLKSGVKLDGIGGYCAYGRKN